MVNGHVLLAGLLVLGLCASLAKRGEAASVRQGDAYARGSADGRRWTIGTRAFRQVLEFREGQLRLASYLNRLAGPPREYAGAGAGAPFVVDDRSGYGGFTVRPAWTHHLPGGTVADPAADGVRVDVKVGDLIGFGVGAHGDYTCDETEWVVTLEYPDGEKHTSSEDTQLAQGPMWFYYLRMAGSGFLEPLDAVEQHDYAGQKVRIAGEASGFRANGGCPHIGPTKCHPANAYDAVRVWRAPKSGTVTIRGQAKNVGCGGAVDLSILRLEQKPETAAAPAPGEPWKLDKGAVRRVSAGGRPAVQLDLMLRRGVLKAQLHVLAYPGTAICRQWLDVENTGGEAVVAQVRPLALALHGEGTYTHYWMVGGNSKEDQGMMKSAVAGEGYRQTVAGTATSEHVPWTALHRQGAPGDGWFCALEYLGPWRLNVERGAGGALAVDAQAPDLECLNLAPGERHSLPAVTLGVFQGDLDDMAARVYDWQYEYLWDYTNPDYYARPKWAVPWFFCSRNLQEQFAGRLAGLDMDADLMRQVGFEMLWDDAGWSTYPGWPEDNYGSVFRNTYEGPDFAQTLRYLEKMGMRWLAWFAGRPSPGVMDSKVASWGNFEWRTDAVGFSGLASDQDLRDKIVHFLDAHPRCSFHTCSGGSTYAHTFDIQRYANTNYFADFGRGLQTNFYFSYLDPPDKWVDIIEPWGTKGSYRPETALQLLTMVPFWGLYATEPDWEHLRRMLEIYRYLLSEGVAGRWSRVCHPRVEGDTEFYYFQRLSRDRMRSCIILKHKAPNPVTLFPRGLLPEHPYVVGFESTRETSTRTGADLMARGITLPDQAPGELIYLGLPGRPGSGTDATAPAPPGRAFRRRETNVGHTGVAVYWSPGSDASWLSYYEVRRGEQVLGKASTGCCFYDHSPGWDAAAAYAVRTVDGDGNASGWTPAEPLPDEPLVASVLGGHFAQQGRDGWSAETTTDDRSFMPMAWVAPAKTPAGDLGGTPNQVGGVEGYWEGPGGARIGRGWQQASEETACVRSWAAPAAGAVRVVGRAMKEWYRQERGRPLRVRILHGAEQVWPAEGWAEARPKDLVGAAHDFTLPVAAGDALRFELAPGDSPDDDLLAWMPRVEYQPEVSQPEEPSTSTSTTTGRSPVLGPYPLRLACALY